MSNAKWHSVGGDIEARLELPYVVVRGKRTKEEKAFFGEAAVDLFKDLFRRERLKSDAITKRKRRRKGFRSKPAPFRVLVQYGPGLDSDFDREIEIVARAQSLGSGYSFLDEQRDLDFGFDRKISAVAAAKRLSELKFNGKKIKVTVEGQVWP